jgi:hypothetical protein
VTVIDGPARRPDHRPSEMGGLDGISTSGRIRDDLGESLWIVADNLPKSRHEHRADRELLTGGDRGEAGPTAPGRWSSASSVEQCRWVRAVVPLPAAGVGVAAGS